MDVENLIVSCRTSNITATLPRTFLLSATILVASSFAYAAPVPGDHADGHRFILCKDGYKVMWPSAGDYHLLAKQCGPRGGVITTGNDGNPNGIFPPPPPPPRSISTRPVKLQPRPLSAESVKAQPARDLKSEPLPATKP